MQKYRKPERSDWLKSIVFIGAYVGVVSVTAFYLLFGRWYLWIALIASGLLLLVLWHTKSTAYRCPLCNAEFEISLLTDLLSPHGISKNGGWLYLKCPVCRKRSKMQVLVKAEENSTSNKGKKTSTVIRIKLLRLVQGKAFFTILREFCPDGLPADQQLKLSRVVIDANFFRTKIWYFLLQI